LKRGVTPVIVYSHMGGYWSREAHSRFYEALKLVYEWVPWDHMVVYIVRGIGDLVAKARIPDRLRCLLCKSLMYRVASIISKKESCRGIATGEAVGQVASQTLQNLRILSRMIDEPVYRPLCCMDKIDIIEYAARLGFNRLSRRVGTCMLKSAHPETSASDRDYRVLKETIKEYDGLLHELVDNAEKIRYQGPQY
jgi:thiamine biosynthesis protein ThiI